MICVNRIVAANSKLICIDVRCLSVQRKQRQWDQWGILRCNNRYCACFCDGAIFRHHDTMSLTLNTWIDVLMQTSAKLVIQICYNQIMKCDTCTRMFNLFLILWHYIYFRFIWTLFTLTSPDWCGCVCWLSRSICILCDRTKNTHTHFPGGCWSQNVVIFVHFIFFRARFCVIDLTGLYKTM